MKYGASKKKKMTKERENIEQSIKSLENDLTDMHTDDSQKQKIWLELETKKRELELLIEYQTKGAIVRSKSRWYNEGEKNTKYFLNLEKRHCKRGTVTQIKINEKDFVATDKEILELQCVTFYQSL